MKPVPPIRLADLSSILVLLAAHSGPVALDLETSARTEWKLRDPKAGLNPWRGRIRLLTLCGAEGIDPLVIDLFALPDARAGLAGIGRELARRGIIIHNALFDLPWLVLHLGWPIPEHIYCTLTLEGILCAGLQVRPVVPKSPDHRIKVSLSLEAALNRRLGVVLPKELQRSDWSRAVLSQEQVTYAANDVRHLHALLREQQSAIVKHCLERTAALDLACIPPLVTATVHGIPIDQQALTAGLRQSDQMLERTKSAVRCLFRAPISLETSGGEDDADTEDPSSEPNGEWLNPNSAIQLRAALERRLGFDPGGTNKAALALIVRKHDKVAADAILAFRRASSLRRFLGQLRDRCEVDGRIHVQFNNSTETGRVTSRRPNLQGLPGDRDPEPGQPPEPSVRRCIAAPPQRQLIGADYAQIELRLAGWVYGEESIKTVYLEEARLMAQGVPEAEVQSRCDLHLRTAARMARVPTAQVTKPMRKKAKMTNFGAIYCIGAKSLALQSVVQYGVDMSEAEGKQMLAEWHREHPAIAQRKRDFYQANRICRLVESRTVIGRRRILEPGYQASPRFALNHPIQGASADITRLAITTLFSRLPQGAVLILSVHDELLVECSEDQAALVRGILEETMTKAANELFPEMPCPVKAVVGNNWAEVK